MKLARLLERSSEPIAGASHSASLLRLRYARFANSLFSLSNEILRTLAQGYAALAYVTKELAKVAEEFGDVFGGPNQLCRWTGS